jgi:hypothetical protein
MTTKQIDDIKRLLAEATPGPWALHNETCVSSGDTMTAQTCDDEPENTPQAEQNAALIVAVVNSLPDLLADIELLREALQAVSQKHPGYGGSGEIARKALAETEVKP